MENENKGKIYVHNNNLLSHRMAICTQQVQNKRSEVNIKAPPPSEPDKQTVWHECE